METASGGAAWRSVLRFLLRLRLRLRYFSLRQLGGLGGFGGRDRLMGTAAICTAADFG